MNVAQPARHFRKKSPKKKKSEPRPEYGANAESALRFLSTTFGMSYVIPPAPGTAGMIFGSCLWFALGKMNLQPFFHGTILLVFAALAGVICHLARPIWGDSEEHFMSIDSAVGMAVAAAPFRPGFHPNWMSMFAVIFVVHWFLSILQPPPISTIRDIDGPVGRIGDDLAAAAFTILITWGLYDRVWSEVLGMR